MTKYSLQSVHSIFPCVFHSLMSSPFPWVASGHSASSSVFTAARERPLICLLYFDPSESCWGMTHSSWLLPALQCPQRMLWSPVTLQIPHPNLRLSLRLWSSQHLHSPGSRNQLLSSPVAVGWCWWGSSVRKLKTFSFRFGFLPFWCFAGCEAKSNVRLIWEDFCHPRLSPRKVSASHLDCASYKSIRNVPT